jgi:hypothetical protein
MWGLNASWGRYNGVPDEADNIEEFASLLRREEGSRSLEDVLETLNLLHKVSRG